MDNNLFGTGLSDNPFQHRCSIIKPLNKRLTMSEYDIVCRDRNLLITMMSDCYLLKLEKKKRTLIKKIYLNLINLIYFFKKNKN